ncbi:MAG TPA: PQQ-dependent sugar dehydrogenase [Candidatus Limnocylindria bacterium]|nr:PQQ-dependent sugar dehydrogenase [Candidatus Limnocylindria bacterium]
MGARRLALGIALAAAGACSAPAALPRPSATASPLPSVASSASPATAAPSATASPAPASTPVALPTPAPTPVQTAAAAIPQVRLARAMGNLAFSSMTGAFQAADGRWYVLEQPGRILTFREGDASATVFLDIRDHVESGGEKGLLGFAFAPDFAQSGIFFVDYTRGGPLRTEIASFSASGTVANKTSEVVILEIAQPFDNHNGGQLAFGPDGYLYIGMGDGGSGGDPMRNGQNTNVLLAKLLRIDVSDRTRYRVPSDNPFAGGGGRGEIWAYGLRNPWRFSFDTETGLLWLGDVGQNQWEEIDLVSRGANYGWNVMEGTHCYNASSCSTAGLTLPVAEYPHTLGCSVTGGFVDRGAVPELRGVYVYGDYCSGRIWGLRYADGRIVGPVQIATSGFAIGSFAQDRAGEVYVLQYAGSGGIYKISR